MGTINFFFTNGTLNSSIMILIVRYQTLIEANFSINLEEKNEKKEDKW